MIGGLPDVRVAVDEAPSSLAVVFYTSGSTGQPKGVMQLQRREVSGGRVRVSFKAPWRSPAAHADMDAHQFLARLCALVPPPGFHMTRYYGVLYKVVNYRPSDR